MAAALGAMVAPALLVTPAVARVLGDRSTRVLSFAFPTAILLVLSLHAAIAEAFLVAHARFSLYAGTMTWALLAALLGALARETPRLRREPWRVPALTPAAGGVLAVVLLVVVAARVPPVYVGNEDAYDHMGYVQRVIALDSMQPDGVLAMPRGATEPVPPDPRKGSLHAVVALVARLAGAPAESTWSALRLVMFPVMVLAFAAFASAFVGHGGRLAATMVLFFLSYSGTGLQLVRSAWDGVNLSSTWYWVATPVALVAARTTMTRPRAVTIALLVVGGVFTHFGAALHVGILALTVVFFAPWLGVRRGDALRVAGVLLVAVALAAGVRLAGAMPRPANAIHAHLQGVMFVGDRWFVMSPMEILRQYGMIFLGGLILFPVTAVLARRHLDTRAALAFCFVPVAVAFIPPLATTLYARGSYMVFRSILNAPVLQVVVLTVAGLAGVAHRRGVVARVAVAAALFAWGAVFVVPALRACEADARAWLHPVSRPQSDPALLEAVSRLPAAAVIVSDPMTSYRLSARLTNRFVAIYEQHANPYDPYALERLRAVRDILSPFAPSTAAVAACREYGVDFVVVNTGRVGGGPLDTWRPSLYGRSLQRLQAMPECFRVVAHGDGFMVFRFDTAGVPRNPWNGTPAPVVVEHPPLNDCPARVPGDVFRITGLSVHPRTVLPGDTVTVTLGYRRDSVGPPALPVLFHLRFDEEGLAKKMRWPGEKYLRRFRDRRSGQFTRFRRDVSPGHGIEDADLWPVGVDLCERFAVVVPDALRPGRYRVELRVVPDALVPNFDIDDLLFNRDHYSGTPCATLTVGDRVIGGGS